MEESKKRDHKNLNSQKDVITPAPALRSQMPESYADGFSIHNLNYVRKFEQSLIDKEIVQVLTNGWSRNILVMQIVNVLREQRKMNE